MAVLFRRCENHHVEVGLRPRGPFSTGAIGPYGGVRQMPCEQRQNGFELLRRDNRSSGLAPCFPAHGLVEADGVVDKVRY